MKNITTSTSVGVDYDIWMTDVLNDKSFKNSMLKPFAQSFVECCPLHTFYNKKN